MVTARPEQPRERAALVVMAIAAVGTVVVADAVARQNADRVDLEGDRLQRASNVQILSRLPDRLPPPAPASVLLIGNSHTYALPGMTRGEPLRPDSGSTLIDELAREVARREPSAVGVRFDRLAYPNFLPVEMLVRVAHLLDRGHRPSVVVLGLTWRNIARDTQTRHDVRRAYADSG